MIVSSFTEKLVNKQFEIIGVNFRMKDILEDKKILVDKKNILWYDYYKFEDAEQYMKWRDYLSNELRGNISEINRIDFEYGMVYKYKKEGSNTLPSLFTITS